MSPPSLVHVNPGDRITAAFMNTLVDEINSLQAQVDALGQVVPPGNPPVITSLQPPDAVTVGEELDVIGLNFAVPAAQNTVTLDGTPVTAFLSGSSATLLKLAVPNIAGLPKDAQLSIQNAGGTAKHTVHVLPPVIIPVGHPTVSDVSGNLGTINAGSQYTFSFKIDASAVSVAETYNVAVGYENVVPASVTAAQWSAATTLIGVTGGQVRATPQTPVTIGVQVVIPAAATAADLKVTVQSVHNDPGASATPLSVPIRVGQAQQNDPRIHTPQIAPADPNAQYRIAADGALEVQYPASAANPTVVAVAINLGFDVATTFHCDVAMESPAPALWTVGAVVPNDLKQSANSSRQVNLPLTLLATGASGEGRFLDLVVKRTDNDAIGQISNSLRFQVRGYHA